MPRLIAFAVPEKPLSYNAFRDVERKAAYARKLRTAFLGAVGTLTIIDPPLYGIVYHLHRREDGTDVDNISKPVWDALRGLAYEDDASVRLRIAGKVRRGRRRLVDLDTSRAPPDAAERLTTLMGKQGYDHILCVELGTLTNAMFAFGLAA